MPSLLRRGPVDALRGHLRTTHSPQIPGVDLRERTSTAEGNRLVPLETLDHRGYRPGDPKITPPWRKTVYHRPEHTGS